MQGDIDTVVRQATSMDASHWKQGQGVGHDGEDWYRREPVHTAEQLEADKKKVERVLVRKGGRLEAEGLGWSFYNKLHFSFPL